MSNDELSLAENPRKRSIAEHLRDGLLDPSGGLTDETLDALRQRLPELPDAGDPVDAATRFADAAVRSWLGELIEACAGPDALVGELDHQAPIRDLDTALAARDRALLVHERAETVNEKADVGRRAGVTATQRPTTRLKLRRQRGAHSPAKGSTRRTPPR